MIKRARSGRRAEAGQAGGEGVRCRPSPDRRAEGTPTPARVSRVRRDPGRVQCDRPEIAVGRAGARGVFEGRRRDGAPAAAHALGRIGQAAADAVPALADVVTGDKETAVRKEAVKTLAVIGPKAAAAVPALVGRAGPTLKPPAAAGGGGPGKIGPDAARALPDLLKGGVHRQGQVGPLPRDPRDRQPGKAGLAAVPDLIKIVKDEEIPEVKLAAIDELAGFGPDAAAAEDALKIAARTADLLSARPPPSAKEDPKIAPVIQWNRRARRHRQ